MNHLRQIELATLLLVCLGLIDEVVKKYFPSFPFTEIIAFIGLVVVGWIVWINRKQHTETNRLKILENFLEKKITQGKTFSNGPIRSLCTSWKGNNEINDDQCIRFGEEYKKWRRQIDQGCKKAYWDKKKIFPFEDGRLPQLVSGRSDYREWLNLDIQQLIYLKKGMTLDDIDKNLDSKSLKEFEDF